MLPVMPALFDPARRAPASPGASITRRSPRLGQGPAEGGRSEARPGGGREPPARGDPREEVRGGAQEGRRDGRAAAPPVRRRLNLPRVVQGAPCGFTPAPSAAAPGGA